MRDRLFQIGACKLRPSLYAFLGRAVTQTWGAATLGAMSRKLIWIEQQRFRGFGCSECAWRFSSSGPPKGLSFDEMMRNFELQRDKEFALHICANHPRVKDNRSE
jgi:hypothetical protein